MQARQITFAEPRNCRRTAAPTGLILAATATGPETRPAGRYDDFIMSFSDAERPLYEVKANLFKGLSHPFRVRILELLSDADEVSVAELLSKTALEASHLSQHLAVLRRHRLVESERRGNHVYYRLTHRQAAQMLAVARQLLVLLLESESERLPDARSLPSAGQGGK